MAPRRSTARARGCPWRSWSRAPRTEAAIAEALLAGAHVFTVDGTIATAGKLIAGIAPRIGWFDLATLKEPYRLEGKKTMGLELAEQLGWETPDVLIYPTGGGTGLVGIWKAYDELAALGWIKARQPAFVAVQAEGCAPVVKAWTEGADVTTMWENAVTDAPGLRVPGPFAGRQMLKILRDTGGHGRAVSEREIVDAQRLLARLEGIWTSPEGAAQCRRADPDEGRGRGRCGHPRDDDLHRLRHQEPAAPDACAVDLAGSEAEVLARVKQAMGL